MRVTDTMRALKPSATGGLAGEFKRAALACGFALGFCLVAIIIANWLQASARTASHASSEAALSTGSLLVVSPTGDLCHQSTIDNSTWRIRSNGWVDCDEALAKIANSAADPRSLGSRLQLIRQGFTGKP
jgi:hypothetical protein